MSRYNDPEQHIYKTTEIDQQHMIAIVHDSRLSPNSVYYMTVHQEIKKVLLKTRTLSYTLKVHLMGVFLGPTVPSWGPPGSHGAHSR